RKRRTFSKEFKKQVVQLYEAGKPRTENGKEYNLTLTAFDKWIQQHKTTETFKPKDKRTPEQEKMNNLQKKKEKNAMKNEIKKQHVQLYEAGKPRTEIVKEYDLTPSAFDKWIQQHKTTGSFEAKDNRTPEQEELIKLRKENEKLAMENDILKQAALIMGRK